MHHIKFSKCTCLSYRNSKYSNNACKNLCFKMLFLSVLCLTMVVLYCQYNTSMVLHTDPSVLIFDRKWLRSGIRSAWKRRWVWCYLPFPTGLKQLSDWKHKTLSIKSKAYQPGKKLSSMHIPLRVHGPLEQFGFR